MNTLSFILCSQQLNTVLFSAVCKICTVSFLLFGDCTEHEPVKKCTVRHSLYFANKNKYIPHIGHIRTVLFYVLIEYEQFHSLSVNMPNTLLQSTYGITLRAS